MKLKGWTRYFLQIVMKKAGLAMITSNKIDFKTKAIVRDKQHYRMIKGMIQQE